MESRPLRLGCVAPKNTPQEVCWLLDFLDADTEPYRRGGAYDCVWFYNLTEEIRVIKRHTDAKVLLTAAEPLRTLPANYDAELLGLCDFYMGYRSFAGPDFSGQFRTYVYPAATVAEVEDHFESALTCERDVDFCIFARHDPNIRAAIGRALAGRKAILAGPLFENPQPNKLEIQRRSRYEFISENDINDYYMSEKLGQALLAGCVPVYYGRRNPTDLVPEELFIDMHDFPGVAEGQGLESVVEHCLTPGVYERHFDAIRSRGKAFLLEHATLETNIIAPIQDYLNGLARAGYRAGKRSLFWVASRWLPRL